MLFNVLDHFQNRIESLGLWPYLQVLYQEEFRALAALLLSFGLVMFFARRVIAWLVRMKVGDSPEFYNADLNELMRSRSGTPTMGGILICGAILASGLLLADLGNRYVVLGLVVLLWLGILGISDDWLKLTAARRNPGSREGLLAWEKLLFQLGIGFMAALFVYMEAGSPDAHVLNLPFQRTYPPAQLEDVLQLPMTLASGVFVLPAVVFVVVGMLLIAGTSNAVNITDGMDGLAGGTVAVASTAMMILAWIAGEPRASAFLMVPYVEGSQELMVLAGAMTGACIGFLWFNVSPSSVFMGDTGSLPLGGLLAFIAVVIRQEILLLLIGGVFLMEIGSVVLQVGYFKLTRGRRIFRCSPIHHHFHLGGWSEHQVVLRFWLVAVILAMFALASLKLR
ncbi:MAG: phospho-N-acetylmuramoyl-pentapeptide-transferase [Planctomycetota bacterium]|nr:phospho-N-acetylmuramoyl-pentapeptide-transferase [Planctomycetota bacterium]MEC9158040.1 phospho-N-acetylmuramoyl-pentapeptide-transferase [Planctomycetota bacterium]